MHAMEEKKKKRRQCRVLVFGQTRGGKRGGEGLEPGKVVSGYQHRGKRKGGTTGPSIGAEGGGALGEKREKNTALAPKGPSGGKTKRTKGKGGNPAGKRAQVLVGKGEEKEKMQATSVKGGGVRGRKKNRCEFGGKGEINYFQGKGGRKGGKRLIFR